MTRILAALLAVAMFLQAAPPLAIAQTYGLPGLLGAVDSEVRVQVGKDDRSVMLSCEEGTLNGTVLPQTSTDGVKFDSDGAATSVAFIDHKGATTPSEAPDGSWTAFSRGILFGTGVVAVRVVVSAQNSGETRCKLTAVPQERTTIIVGPDGSTLRSASVTNSAPAADANGLVVRIAGSAGTGTSIADGQPVTAGDTAGTLAMGVYQSSPASVADGKAGILRISPTRGLVLGGFETPNGDSMVDETTNSLNVNGATVFTNGGQSASSTTTAYKNCPSQIFHRMDSASTTLISGLTGVSGETYRFCAVMVQFDTEAAGNTVQLVRGTSGGVNCATSVASVTLPLTKSFVLGNNTNEVWDGGATNVQICGKLVGTSGATLHIRYGSM